jgi:hypothetical protein
MRDNITATYVSSSVKVVFPEYLVYMDFPSAPVRLWSGIDNQVFTDISGSGTYIGVGTLGSISTVAETTEVSAKGIELTLSGIPQSHISLALTENYRGRPVAVYLLIYSADRNTYQKTMIFRGRMDQMIINEGEKESSITVKCESRLIELNRPRERRYTDEHQKSLYPADTGLEFVAGMADKILYWGANAPSAPINSNGGGGGGFGGDEGIITPP